MSMANFMKMRTIFYFNTFTDSRVKIFRVLDHIVVISQKNIISILKLRLNHCTPVRFHASGFFAKHNF